MPVKVNKTDGKYKVTHGGKVSAKGTTKAKAESQARLLRGVEHGWKPTGKKATKGKANIGSAAMTHMMPGGHRMSNVEMKKMMKTGRVRMG